MPARHPTTRRDPDTTPPPRVAALRPPAWWVRLGATLVAGGLAASAAGACGARSELILPWPPPTPSICDANFSATAPPVTLVVYMVFDTSGSMAGVTAFGNTKWEAVNEAMATFLEDPEAEGIRLGLGFYPRHDVTVPSFCQGGWGCEPATACVDYGICEPVGGGLCTDSSQCPDPGDSCVMQGYCTGTGDSCDPTTQLDCPTGACTSWGYCDNYTLCESGDYLITALGTLPDDAEWALTAIATSQPDGFTPTLPAFAGAMTSAQTWRNEHPAHEVVVVLATDGVPTLCDPALQSGGLAAAMDNLDDVAAEGQEAGISSFVIGVFAPEEEVAVAQYLDALATSGGTDEAFIINTEQDVAARLVEAFNAVRTVTICEYEIPAEGLSYDATRFLVSISTADGADLELERRDSAAACDPVTGGFFFDHDPTGSEPPTRIILCPASCDLDPVALHVTCGP